MSKLPGLYLASASPRRQAFFRAMGLEFSIAESNFDEHNPTLTKQPASLAMRNAIGKAQSARNTENLRSGFIVGADTLVWCDGRLFGKPGSKDEAAAMLRMLSAKTHRVISGICVLNANTGKFITGSDTSLVSFRRLDRKIIHDYVEHGEPMDKAGAYAIQGLASSFILRVEGAIDTVIGLPVRLLLSLLKKSGYQYIDSKLTV